MKHAKYTFLSLSLIGSIVLMGAVQAVIAQEGQIFSKEVEKARAEAKNPQKPPSAKLGIIECGGPITKVIDLAFEGIKSTSAYYFSSNLPGGGEGGGFDPIPVLRTQVVLQDKSCLDAHLSAMVFSKQTFNVAPITLFQVSLRPVSSGPPLHMTGHYLNLANGPAVALESESLVDMYSSNFFQRVATNSTVPPGTYWVEVWWAGSTPQGALGADFVLKLYLK